jgi:hypothetical protein
MSQEKYIGMDFASLESRSFPQCLARAVSQFACPI